MNRIFAAAAGTTAFLAAGACSAQDAFGDAFWQFKAAGGFDYSSGSYGDATKTAVTYTSATLSAGKGPWTVKAVVPWIAVSGPAVLFQGAAGGAAGSGVSRQTSGPGDINLSAAYALQRFYTRGLFIDLTARIKAPVASLGKGLGTGQADAAVQIDIAQSIGAFMPFVAVGYQANGRPKGYHLRDVVYGTAGLQYTWDQRVTSGVLFDYRRSALATAADPREGTAYLNIKFAQSWAVNIYGVVGFSPNSPDAGGGIVLSYRLP